MPEPLSGMRVVEMATALQGPAAGGYLAEMGADVIRVEPPGGDGSRYGRGVNNDNPPGTVGTQFNSTSRGKRAISLDAKSEAGIEVIYRLLESADAFTSNYREAALERLGLGYESCKQRNPQLVYAVANGFGPKGPLAGKAMTDIAAQARGGLMSMIGEADGPVMRAGVTVADLAGAMQLALGTVTALLARERHGVGQKVNVSAYGAQIWLQSWELNHAGLTGQHLERDGAHHPNVPGMEAIYEASDGGWIAISFAKTEEAWQALCEFGGIPAIGTDERWNSVQKRVGMSTDPQIARAVRPILAAAFRSRTTAEWEDFFETQPQIIANRVFNHADVLNDPQARANGYITDVELPPVGTVPFVGPLIHFSETPPSVKGPPPELDQHTEEILLELGYEWDEITTITESTRAQMRQRFRALGLDPPY